jgi:hypothetical protein
MDPSERATTYANAISEVMNYLDHIRSVRFAPPVVSAPELAEWAGIVDRALTALADLEVEIQAGRAQTSMRLTGEVQGTLADLRAQLANVAPDKTPQFGLFHRAEVARLALMKALSA